MKTAMRVSGISHKPKQAISNIRGTPSAYDTISVFENGGYQTYVVTHCIECGEETRVHWNTGGADPRFVDKKMRGLGWHYDAFKPKACVCPSCVTGKKLPYHVDAAAAGRANAEIGPTSFDAYLRDHTSEEPDMAKSTNSFVPTTQPATSTDVLGAATALINADDYNRKLTSHEKAKVRGVLDSHFDDQIGRYIDHYDDQRVGRELNLPWALVAEYRELAYGPIKDDPAVEAVKTEVKALRDEFVIISKAAEDLRASIVRIEGRLVNVEAKAKKL